jgi:hypothetical protein
MTDHQGTFDGLGAPTKSTIVGVAAAFGDDVDLDLGDTVTLTVKGHVTLTGRESLEEKGIRPVIKIRADLVELQS